MKISWLVRGRDCRRGHVHRCRECGRRFTDDEPGSWADNRSDEYPELCSPYSCKQLGGIVHHVLPHCCGMRTGISVRAQHGPPVRAHETPILSP